MIFILYKRCDERGSLGSESDSDDDEEIKPENTTTLQIKTDEDTSAKEDDGEEE